MKIYIILVVSLAFSSVCTSAGVHKKRSLLDDLLERFFDDDDDDDDHEEGQKQLIVTSFPGAINEEYYREELGEEEWCEKISYFLLTFAMAAQEVGDIFMITYHEGMGTDCFNPEMFKCTDAYLLPLPDSLDIWMRDFTTVNQESPTHFRFDPWYLNGTGPLVADDFLQQMHSVGLDLTVNDSLALDGGNVVDCEDKAILTWRVREENDLNDGEIRQIVQDALPEKDLCFIRDVDVEDDTTGHADGVVACLDKNTIILPDYNEYDPSDYNLRLSQIKGCYPETKYPDLQIIKMESYDAEDKKKRSKLLHLLKKWLDNETGNRRRKREAVERFTSATGSTINMLVTDLGIYVPSFESIGINNDANFNLIKAHAGNKNVQRVDTGELSFMGGAVRCMSWQMYADIDEALILLNAAYQPQEDYDDFSVCDDNTDALSLFNHFNGI